MRIYLVKKSKNKDENRFFFLYLFIFIEWKKELWILKKELSFSVSIIIEKSSIMLSSCGKLLNISKYQSIEWEGVLGLNSSNDSLLCCN